MPALKKSPTACKHLTFEDRAEIQGCLYRGVSFKTIARRTGKTLRPSPGKPEGTGRSFRRKQVGTRIRDRMTLIYADRVVPVMSATRWRHS